MAITVTPPLPLPSFPRLGPATIPVSATLAANETMDARRRHGEPVLPLAFGEAGLPAHRMLRAALARAAGFNSYGPVAGHAALREAAASYWGRRGLPTDAEAVICGPGSKALLFGLTAAIGGDVAVTRPSWVSYAADRGDRERLHLRARLLDRQGRLADPRRHPGAAGRPAVRRH